MDCDVIKQRLPDVQCFFTQKNATQYDDLECNSLHLVVKLITFKSKTEINSVRTRHLRGYEYDSKRAYTDRFRIKNEQGEHLLFVFFVTEPNKKSIPFMIMYW